MVLGLLVLAAAWAAWAWPLGWLPALAGVLGVLGLHALALALEMVLVRCTHADDPTPRASAAVLAQAWWAELRTALQVFGWRQPFRSQCWPDHLPATSRGQRGVLLVHGYVCNRGFWNPWMQRLAAQGTPFVAVNLEPVFASIDDVVSGLEAGVQQLEAATGLPPVVVAHSMGGLVLRRWYAEAAARGRLHRAITLGTPHQGTWLARWGPSRNARQMRPDSAWLRNLAAREATVNPPPAQRFTCFHSHADNVVFPPRRATWTGADNRHLPGYAHVHLATAPEPWAELQHWLQAPAPGPG
jgi:triacylglycerol esterase/lipase EstA (alpha/beta hydrolase family)